MRPADRPGVLGSRPGAADQHRVIFGELAQQGQRPLEPAGLDRGDDHGSRIEALSGLTDRARRHVCTEERDPPPVLADRETECDQAEIVALSRGAGEQGERAGARTPAAGEAEQPRAQQLGREVLLGDRDLPASPARAELRQRRQEEGRERGLEREPSQRLVDDRVRRGLVECLDRIQQQLHLAVEDRVADGRRYASLGNARMLGVIAGELRGLGR